MGFTPRASMGLETYSVNEIRREKARLKSSKTLFDMELPLPISCNAMHAPGRDGGIILTQGTRQYYWNMSALLDQEWAGGLIQGRLCAEVWLYENDLRRRDISNYTKTLFDALEGKVFENDSQIDEVHLYRGEMRKTPGVRVRISHCEDQTERRPMREIEKERDLADAKHARSKQANGTLARAGGGAIALKTMQVFKVPEPRKRPKSFGEGK